MKIAYGKTAWLAFFLCFVALGARAQQPKIGYVDLNGVLEGTIEGKAIVEKLKSEFAAKQKVLNDRMKGFEEKMKQFQAQASMLKEDVRKDRAQVLAKEQEELQGLLMQYQGEINNKKGQELGKFEEKLQGVIEFVAKREGIDYVVRHEVLLFGPSKMDVTNEVVREYDKRNPGAGKPAAKGN
jgi:Skp family chaperone for outer membrane proteins